MRRTVTVTGDPSDATQAPAYPMERACPYEMPVGYASLRGRGPLSRVTLYDGRQVWLVAGNAEGRALLLDPRLSSDTGRPGFPYLTRGLAAQRDMSALPLIGVDDPEHGRQRRLLTSAFGVRRIAGLRPLIARIAGELIDAMLAGGDQAELVSAYTLPLASATNLALLGVPPADGRHIDEYARAALSPSDEDEGRTAKRSFEELCAYLDQLIARKEREPGDGLIDDLLAARTSGSGIERARLPMLCAVLLIGGNESTSNTLASSVLVLLEHPEQMERLRTDPSLTAGAVDELTRFISVTDAVPRVATADIEIAGQTIRSGDGVIVSTMLMNRDPTAWAHPDTVDVGHKAGRHVAFGFGIHQCVGQNLARAEMEIALNTLIQRVPTLRRAVPSQRVPGDAPYGPDGVATLPVAW